MRGQVSCCCLAFPNLLSRNIDIIARMLCTTTSYLAVSSHVYKPAVKGCSACAAGTPYEDGTFRMKMILGPDFPNTPPKGVSSGAQCSPEMLAIRFVSCSCLAQVAFAARYTRSELLLLHLLPC